MSTQEDRMEEVQAMKAASAARDIWKQSNKNKHIIYTILHLHTSTFFVILLLPSEESIREREYRFNLETELYDLPRRKVLTDSKDPPLAS